MWFVELMGGELTGQAEADLGSARGLWQMRVHSRGAGRAEGGISIPGLRAPDVAS